MVSHFYGRSPRGFPEDAIFFSACGAKYETGLSASSRGSVRKYAEDLADAARRL